MNLFSVSSYVMCSLSIIYSFVRLALCVFFLHSFLFILYLFYLILNQFVWCCMLTVVKLYRRVNRLEFWWTIESEWVKPVLQVHIWQTNLCFVIILLLKYIHIRTEWLCLFFKLKWTKRKKTHSHTDTLYRVIKMNATCFHSKWKKKVSIFVYEKL